MKIETRHLSLVEDFQARHRTGLMTLLFTDMAGSTDMKRQLGDTIAGAIMEKHHHCVRDLLKAIPSAQEVDRTGDSFFIVFDSPSNAVAFAVRLHNKLRALSQEVRFPVRDRIGIHVGEVIYEKDETEGRLRNFAGIQVDTCARVMSICEPERTLLTRFAFDNARQSLRGRRDDLGDLQWTSHGLFQMKGVDRPLEICEVWERGKSQPDPLADGEKATRFLSTPVLGPDSELERAEGWRGMVARRRREVLISVALAWIAVFVVICSPFVVSRLAGISYDFAYFLRRASLPTEALVVYMDEESHQGLKQPDNAPWDHAIHARMVNRLTRAGAKAIAFDVLFTDRQPNSQELIDSCVQSGRVSVSALEKGSFGDWKLVTPFDELRQVVSYGAVELFSKTSTARRQAGIQGLVKIPTLAELVANRMVPGSSNAVGRWLNYYGPARTIPNVSYIQALSTNDYPDALFRDKAVFIGAAPFVGYTGGRGTNDYVRSYDEFPTPYGKMSGVELNATAALNLMRGETLRRISPYAEVGIYLGLAVVIAILISMLRTGWAVILGVSLVFLTGYVSSWMVWKTHEWFRWGILAFVEIPVIVLCSVAVRTDRLTRQKRELEATLEAQRTEFITKASLFQNQPDTEVVDQSGKPSIPDHQLFAPIGKGGYGEVWLGMDLTNSYRAIKVVRSKNFDSNKPFEREFEGIKQFAPISREHPGLVDVLHVGMKEKEGYFFYIMEAADDIVSGRGIEPLAYRPKTLSSLLEGNQALGAHEFFRMAIQLCQGLHFLHQKGLLHRDIKPANVLYVSGRPQLADPGLVARPSEAVSEVSMLGTVGYMAPENVASPASDVYSLGKVLYQAAFGRPVAAFPELPTFLINGENQAYFMGLNDIVLKACSRDPAERHSSADQLRQELEDLGRAVGIFKTQTSANKPT